MVTPPPSWAKGRSRRQRQPTVCVSAKLVCERRWVVPASAPVLELIVEEVEPEAEIETVGRRR